MEAERGRSQWDQDRNCKCREGERKRPTTSLFDGFAGLFPSGKARTKIEQFFKTKRLHFLAGFGAASSGGAMDQKCFICIELTDFLVKIGRIEV